MVPGTGLCSRCRRLIGSAGALFEGEFGGVGVVTDGGEGQELQAIFKLALDHIEAIGGDAVFGAVERSQLPLGKVPQGRSQFLPRASGQLLQIEQRQSRRLVAADPLTIEQA